MNIKLDENLPTRFGPALAMKEEVSPLGKVAVVSLIAVVIGVALANIARGEVRNPAAFGVALVGFALFSIAKLSVILRHRFVSFGSKPMTEGMANLYRAGYWLMIVGIPATFT